MVADKQTNKHTYKQLNKLHTSLFTVNGSNNTIQLNNEKRQQRDAIGTQYTQNSLAYIIHNVCEYTTAFFFFFFAFLL